MAQQLIAVDIGNSRIKLGLFDVAVDAAALPLPSETLELPLVNREGDFLAAPLEQYCRRHACSDAVWRICSVNGAAKERFIASVRKLERELGRTWSLQPIANDAVPMKVHVHYPQRVGTDRLMAAVAANRLRDPERAAVVVDMGTAITVDLVTDDGAFDGGGILPGLAMSARALAEQTDALPHITIDTWYEPPSPIGKATQPAIESGLFWGAVGAIRELVQRYSDELPRRPQVFISGGGSELVARTLAHSRELEVRHVPHLVLSGIALVQP